jgi:hypothetical protein
MQVPLFRLQCGKHCPAIPVSLPKVYTILEQTRNTDNHALLTGLASYEWGKLGSTSAAGRFAAATPRDDFQIQDDKPYAEVG